MLQELLRQFKAQKWRWTDIRTVMTDKDMAERDQQLPHVLLLLCLFHVLCVCFMCCVLWTAKSQHQR